MTTHAPQPAPLMGALFDLDGTLYSTELVHQRCIRETFEAYTQTHVDPDELRAYAGLTYEDHFEHMLAMRGLEQEQHIIAQLTAEAEAKRDNILQSESNLVPGIVEFLQNLSSHGIRLAVVSNGSRDYISTVLQQHNISALFETCIGYEDVRNRKPHPEPYRVALQRMQLTPDTVVAFEDTPGGVESARLAGIRVIGLTTTFSSDDLQKTYDTIHDYRNMTFEQLIHMLHHENAPQ